jgi:flagellar FliJ protein
MEKYIQTCRRQEQQELDAREQKLADEAANRLYQRRR